MVYWVDTTILPSGDPEEQRRVVVLDVPATVDGTVVVVSRSGVDDFGVADVDAVAAAGSPVATRSRVGCGRRPT